MIVLTDDGVVGWPERLLAIEAEVDRAVSQLVVHGIGRGTPLFDPPLPVWDPPGWDRCLRRWATKHAAPSPPLTRITTSPGLQALQAETGLVD